MSRSWGGTEHYAIQIGAGLHARGHDIRLLWEDPVVGERAREAGVPQMKCPLRNDADLRGIHRLYQIFRDQRTDVVLMTKWREYWLGGLAAKLARVPLTVMSLGLRMVPKDDLKRRLIFRLADRVVVNAEEIRESLRKRPWIDAAKIEVVHNGVDLSRFRPGGDGNVFRHEVGIPLDAPLVGTIGAMSPQKDHDLFVRAAAVLHAEMPATHFVLVGEGFLRPQISARIRELELDRCFHLAGFRHDVRPALAAFDLFVLSSYNEGMAWVLLEALACGLPIVATDVSGTRACLDQGVNGLIVPPREATALSSGISDLLADAPLRRRMGENSRRIAEERFDAQEMLTDTLKIFQASPTRGDIPPLK
jgi:glycosyltransferase involved in cell wall biosynthesis